MSGSASWASEKLVCIAGSSEVAIHAARVQDAARIEALLDPRTQRGERAALRLEDGHDAAQRCPAADQRGVPAESGKRGADRRRAAIIVAPAAADGEPDEAAAPIEEMSGLDLAGQRGGQRPRAPRRQRQPPDYAFAVIAQQCDVGDLAPDQRRVGAVQLLGGAEPGEL